MSEEYYELDVYAEEWEYVIGKMLKRYSPLPDGEKISLIIVPHDGYDTYKLRKDQVPVAALAVALGVTIDAISTSPKIVLRGFKQVKYWQTPTVDYCGEA